MNRTIMLACLALLAGLTSACPKQDSGQAGAGAQTPATGSPAAQPDQAGSGQATPKPVNTASTALELEAAELKIGQRQLIRIPQDGNYLIRIEKLGQAADGKVEQKELDRFSPVSGHDTSNGWLPESSGKYSVVLEDSSGMELDREKFTVSAWPKGDPVKQEMPFVTINNGEVTADMVLEVGLPIVAYWLVPDDFPHDAWIGLFKVDGNFEGSATADDAEDSALLSSSKGQFTFFPRTAGRYVVRLFSSSEIAASHVGDSQEITVVEEYDKQ